MILKDSEDGKIDLEKLYPIIDKACEEMQSIIYAKDEQLEKIKRHDRLMRDKAHRFDKEIRLLKDQIGITDL